MTWRDQWNNTGLELLLSMCMTVFARKPLLTTVIAAGDWSGLPAALVVVVAL